MTKDEDDSAERPSSRTGVEAVGITGSAHRSRQNTMSQVRCGGVLLKLLTPLLIVVDIQQRRCEEGCGKAGWYAGLLFRVTI